MRNRLGLRAWLVAAALLAPLSSHAQAFRAYLSSHGSDNPTCAVSTPCRLLPAALNAVADSGEIWILDSANFNVGTVTIGKNVIVQAIPGQMGSIAPSSGTPAIIISPGVRVSLRNISMITSAASPGTDGIQMTTGSLNVENSVFEVRGTSASAFNGNAIVVNGSGTVSVRDSVFRHGQRGIYARNGAKVEVSGSKFDDLGNGYGIWGAGVYAEGGTATTRVTVSDSDFSNNYVGLWLLATTSYTTASATLSGSTLTHNAYGVSAQTAVSNSSVTVTASGNNISNNGYGIDVDTDGTGVSAIFEGMSNNIVRNNPGGNLVAGAGASITTFTPF